LPQHLGLAGKDATVPKIASRIYEDPDCMLMPMLADARGCWVVDLLLEKT
jgi:hypothetical protein